MLRSLDLWIVRSLDWWIVRSSDREIDGVLDG